MFRLPLACGMLMGCFTLANAGFSQDGQVQEEPPPPLANPTGVILASPDGSFQSLQFHAVASEGPIEFRGSGSTFTFGIRTPGVMGLLNDPQIQKELEMVDDQLSQLQEMQRDYQQRVQERMQGLTDESGQFDVQRSREIGREMQGLRAELEEQFRQVLLPHQSDRLDQVRFHMDMQNQGTVGVLTGDALAEKLGLSDEQKERLRERAEEIEAEVREEMRRIQAEARRKLFAELTPSQRDRLREIIGDDFDYERPDPRRSNTQRIQRSQPDSSSDE